MRIIKRITVLTLVSVMMLAVSGCGEKTGVIQDMATLPSPTLGQIETKTVQTTTQEAIQIPKQTDAANALTFSNTTYALPEGYVDQGETIGSMLYSKPQNGQYISTISYYVQNETLYTSTLMQEAYKLKIEEVYGACTEVSTKKINSREYTVYSYKDYAHINGTIEIEIYVFSDGNTTVYTECAYMKGYENGREDIDTFMNSINIK